MRAAPEPDDATRAAEVSCVLCGAAPARRRFVKEEIPYYDCPACGFVFSRPAMNANLENALEDYEPAYLDYLEPSEEDEINQQALLRWAEGFGALRDGPLLDVGAGSGKFVRFLRARGLDARGLEPALPLYERFLAGDPHFARRTLEAFAGEPDRPAFRAVFACDVIEHVADPGAFLAACREVLEPRGHLFVSTPDVSSLLARAWGRGWHYFNRYHLSYFSRSTLAALAARHGLREIGFDRLPRLKSLRYLLQYAADFVLGGSVRVPDRLRRPTLRVNLHDTLYAAFERV